MKLNYEVFKNDDMIYESNRWAEVLLFINAVQQRGKTDDMRVKFNRLIYSDLTVDELYTLMAKRERDHIRHITLQDIDSMHMENQEKDENNLYRSLPSVSRHSGCS